MVTAATALVLLALATPAQRPAASAAQAQRNELRAREARKACAAGKTERGVELLAEIIAESEGENAANAVYNQARCYQQNGWVEEALVRFREYLRIAPALPRADRQRIEGYLRELAAERDARAAAAARAASAPALLAAGTAADAPGASTALAARTGDPTARRTRALGIAALAAGGVAVAAFATGAYFGHRADRAERAIEAVDQPVHNRDFQRTWDRGQRFETWQWIGYATGMAAVTAGTTLYVLHRERTRVEAARARTLAATISPAPGAAGVQGVVTLQGRF
jgi:hypothetical protein